MDWSFLKSEFVWGVLLGLLLSAFGAWLQSLILSSMQAKEKRNLVKNFCIDLIRNIQKISKEMDDVRDRARAIQHDFLELINVELAVYGRNREHMVHLPDDLRSDVRQFMSSVAVRQASINYYLGGYYKITGLANQVRGEGRGPEAERIESTSLIPLGEAQKQADKLTAVVGTADALLQRLKTFKA